MPQVSKHIYIPATDIREPEAFNTVFKKYYASLCYFSEKIIGDSSEAKDIVSDFFSKLWKQERKFESENHLRSFLYKSIRNGCMDRLKVSKREKERQALFHNDLDGTEKAHINEMIQAEVLRQIYQEIKNLPEQCRKIVSLSYIDGKKNEEIANELGLSIQTVKNQKTRAISILKNKLPIEVFYCFLFFTA